MSNDKMMIVYNGGAYLALSRKILDDDTIWYECLPLNGTTTVWYQDMDLVFDKTIVRTPFPKVSKALAIGLEVLPVADIVVAKIFDSAAFARFATRFNEDFIETVNEDEIYDQVEVTHFNEILTSRFGIIEGDVIFVSNINNMEQKELDRAVLSILYYHNMGVSYELPVNDYLFVFNVDGTEYQLMERMCDWALGTRDNNEIIKLFDKNLHFLQALDQSLRFLKSIAPQD